jgi:hypothetical protein
VLKQAGYWQNPFVPHIVEQQVGSVPPAGEQEVVVPWQHTPLLLPEVPQLPEQQPWGLDVHDCPSLVQQTLLDEPLTCVQEVEFDTNPQQSPDPVH